MVKGIIEVWTQLVCLKCVGSEELRAERWRADVISPSLTLKNTERVSWNFKKYLNFTGHRTMC